MAAAGEEHGTFRFVQGLSQDTSLLTDAEKTSLSTAGVNVSYKFFGIDNPIQYGNRTPRSRSTDAVWAEASGSRVAMAIAAQGDAILRRYVHVRIPPGKAAQCQGELGAMLEDFRENGALYGNTPAEAFSVDCTSTQVNPPEQLEAGLFKAVITFRTTPSPDRVRLELSRVSITTTL